jgi:hypothetical protein
MNKELTVGEVYKSVQLATATFSDGGTVNEKDIKNIHAGIKNLNIRDYLMGLPNEIGLDKSIEFVKILKTNSKPSTPWRTILSAYAYEQGKIKEAKDLLPKGNYPLATLLSRVYKAEWPPYSLVEMRNQLHPSVKKNLEQDQNKLLKETI